MWRWGGLLLCVVVACDEEMSVSNDVGPAEGGATDVGSDEAGEAGADSAADAGPRGGSLVHVSTGMTVDLGRHYDFDGDGDRDNAIADLGDPSAGILASVLDSFLQAASEAGERLVAHYPWLDDRVTPYDADTGFHIYVFIDYDVPPDPTDDLSGEELVYADGRSLDSCGVPRFGSGAVSIIDGAITIDSGRLGLGLSDALIALDALRGEGLFEPGARRSDLLLCGVSTVRDLGASGPIVPAEGRSALEQLLSGGAAFGVPTLPGAAPDVDLDGDGLERFELDAEGLLETCVDGDSTVVTGRDCWADERMADGLSFCFHVEGVPVLFAGRQPGWEYEVPLGCPSGVEPEEEVFGEVYRVPGSCAPDGERCRPYDETPCCDPSQVCSGADTVAFRCLDRCEPSPCSYGEFLGSCIDRHCRPVGFVAVDVECVPGVEGCTTPYGATEGTTCVPETSRHGERTFCWETCDVVPNACQALKDCVPLAFEDGGVCKVEPAAE